MPAVIDKADLPYLGNSHELEGYLYGDAPVCIILFDGPPGSGPKLHRHPYAEVFLVQEGIATILSRALAAGKLAAIHCGSPEMAAGMTTRRIVSDGVAPIASEPSRIRSRRITFIESRSAVFAFASTPT